MSFSDLHILEDTKQTTLLIQSLWAKHISQNFQTTSKLFVKNCFKFSGYSLKVI